ncbi:hypothetical protein LTR56_016583 [Elasticomyces elasticus]|nr:hypothetical protein LTR56_016583 [Elasticomyces elasticus]KAK3650614.1 hypothetical protein LTR22_012472 [Elasticomyces elasticus]KAK4913947.1 hypothetical protein LTR49_017765 [Elasticomyces elasticus]KAK5753111.1 hypothetical protein LTS12_016790 [Elasticomyces elasticus]
MSRNVVQISERDSKIIRELDGEIDDWKRKYEAVVATQADSAGLREELRKKDEEIATLKRERDAALHEASTLRLELTNVGMAEEELTGADPKLLSGAVDLKADGAQVRKHVTDRKLRQRMAPARLERLDNENDMEWLLRQRKVEGFNFNQRAGRADVATLSAGASNAAWQTPANPAPFRGGFTGSRGRGGQNHNGQNHNFAPPDTRSDIEKAVAKRRARREGGN